MRSSRGALVVGLALLTQASAAFALGFGRIGSSTTLGQQLDFSVVLTADGNESLTPPCVTAEVSIGDNPLPSTQVRTRLDQPADGGPTVLHVMTQVRIDEPVASVNVTVGCPARLSRKFVVFIDPPVIASPPNVAALAAPAASASESPTAGGARASADPRSDAATAPVASAGSAGSAVAPPRRTAAASGSRSSRPVARTARQPAITARRATPVEPRRAALAVPRQGGSSSGQGSTAAAPRLKLEADLQPMRTAASTAAALATAPTTAAASAGEPTALAAGGVDDDQRRIRQLEQDIQKLLSEAQATRASLADLQARLRDAESARFLNPWTYALLGLVALLLAALLWLLWRQSRLQRESVWWAGGTEADATAAVVTPPPADAGPGSEPGALGAAVAGPALPAPPPAPAPAAAPQRFVVAGLADDEPRSTPFDPLVTAVGDPLRDMSVEELIDMEQQADFFVVLGQDDAAIDLLMGHVRHAGNTSPLAYLKLLEIYRRRGEREPYERVRERFDRRFNAAAPEWDATAGPGHALEDYPDVAGSLQAVWPDPAQAMATLESLLFRHDASVGTFDLPAYAELLFLYSQARDLAEHDIPTGTVDLLLPIGEEPATFTLSTATEPMPLGVTAPPSSLRSMPFDAISPPPPLSLSKPGPVPPLPPAQPAADREPASIDFDLDDFDVPAPAVRR